MIQRLRDSGLFEERDPASERDRMLHGVGEARCLYLLQAVCFEG